MSATIEVTARKVVEVLLADGWHQVHRQSFRIGSYKVVAGDEMYDLLCLSMEPGVPGFTFEDVRGRQLSGPLTSILATRT
jgi:hypothetical protein